MIYVKSCNKHVSGFSLTISGEKNKLIYNNCFLCIVYVNLWLKQNKINVIYKNLDNDNTYTLFYNYNTSKKIIW